MKKRPWLIGISAALLLLFTFKGIGWYRWSHLSTAEKAGTITEKMAQHLDLSDTQKGQIYALNLQKMEAFEAGCKSGEHNRQDWKQMRESWKNDVRNILTPEQQEKFWH